MGDIGKARHDDDLADNYLRAGGVAAIWIDGGRAHRRGGRCDRRRPAGRIVYCCIRGDHFRLSYHLYDWKHSVQASPLSSRVSSRRWWPGSLEGARAAVAAFHAAIEKMEAVRRTIRLQGRVQGRPERGPNHPLLGLPARPKAAMLDGHRGAAVRLPSGFAPNHILAVFFTKPRCAHSLFRRSPS